MAFPYQFLLKTLLPQLLMAKDKKKHSKKDKASEDIMDVAALSLRKFRKVSKQLSKLSTGQKVVGGLALAAAGLVYLAARETDNPPGDDAPAAEEEPTRPATSARKSRKGHRSQPE